MLHFSQVFKLSDVQENIISNCFGIRWKSCIQMSQIWSQSTAKITFKSFLDSLTFWANPTWDFCPEVGHSQKKMFHNQSYGSIERNWSSEWVGAILCPSIGRLGKRKTRTDIKRPCYSTAMNSWFCSLWQVYFTTCRWFGGCSRRFCWYPALFFIPTTMV